MEDLHIQTLWVDILKITVARTPKLLRYRHFHTKGTVVDTNRPSAAKFHISRRKLLWSYPTKNTFNQGSSRARHARAHAHTYFE